MEWLPVQLQNHERHRVNKNSMNLYHLLPSAAKCGKALPLTLPMWSGLAIPYYLRNEIRVQDPAKLTHRYGVSVRPRV
jgi:hypothetical protein